MSVTSEINHLDDRLRDLYREVRTQNEIIGVLRGEIIKLIKRVQALEAGAAFSQRDPAEDLPRQEQ